MGQGNRFALLFFGTAVSLLGLFFWLIRRTPPAPPPLAVTMNAASLQASAAKQAAFADDKPKFSVRSGVVQVRIHNVTKPAYRPLESLAVALGRYPQAPRFCVTWGCFYGRHSSKTTVLYNRQRHWLCYECTGFATPWGGFRQHSVFTGVTDVALRQDAQAHKNSTRPVPFDQDVDVVFSELPQYGCPRKSGGIYRQSA